MGDRFLLLLAAALALAAAAAPAAAGCQLAKLAELPVTMRGLSPTIPARIEGHDTVLLADSGAFFSLLTPQSAAKFGLKPGGAPGGMIQGATGVARVSVVTAKDFSVFGQDLKNVDFLVVDADGGPDGILGMNFLGVTDTEYDLANGVIRFFKPMGCEKSSLAYWAGDKGFGTIALQETTPASPHIRGKAQVNGHWVDVSFDTGAPVSMLTVAAAARAGVTTTSPGVTFEVATRGLGSRRVLDTWVGSFDSFTLGDETIRNAKLRFAAFGAGGDMVLGADFFLSHHIYVSKAQHRLYFTYNGGPVFRLDDAPPAQAADPDAAAADALMDAPALARRAAAFAARKDWPHALADYGRAIALDPKEPAYPYERARVHLAARQPAEALADLDQALKLKPDHVEALIGRGALKLDDKDDAGARADFDAAVRIDPHRGLDVGGVYGDRQRYEASIAQFNQWIAAYPADPALSVALNDRCWARAVLGRELNEALADCDKAVDLRPKTATFLDSRGLVRVRLGQFDRAIADYDAAVRGGSRSAWTMYGRGLAKLGKGLKAEGEADLRAAAAIDPDISDKAKAHGLAP